MKRIRTMIGMIVLCVSLGRGDPSPWIFPSDPPVTLDLSAIPLRQLFETLAKQGKFTVLFDEQVPLTKSVAAFSVFQTPLSKAYALALQLNGLGALQVDPAVFVIYPLAKESGYVKTGRALFPLAFIDVNRVLPILQGTYQPTSAGNATLRFLAEERRNWLIALGPQAALDDLGRYLKELDVQAPQVLVEIRVLETSRDKSREYGAELTDYKTAFSKLFPEDQFRRLSINDFSGFLKYLQTASEVKLRASPNVRVADRESATISIADQVAVPISTTQIASGVQTGGQPTSVTTTQTQFFDVGVKVAVTATIHNADTVTLQLKLEVSSLGKASAGTNIPDIGKRVVETKIQLTNGEFVALGGLKREEERETHRGVPVLSDLPILGALFRGTTTQSVETEIILSVTPHILMPKAQTQP